MAVETDKLILQLEAQLNQFNRAMRQAEREADRASGKIEQRFRQNNARVSQGFDRMGAQIATALATIGVGLVVRDVVALGDAWTRTGNALAVAGFEGEQIRNVQQQIADIALRTNSDLEATADLFSRMFRSSEDLGLSLERVAAITETVSKALAGASQAERASAIRQFGQGLQSGRFQGDELRALLESAPVLARAIADEFGVAVGQLRELGATGELTADRVVAAIERAAPEIEAAFARTTRSVADSFTNLRTQLTRYIGTSEATSGANRALAGSIQFVATNFDALAEAIVITAAVLGGGFAGVAIGRAVAGLVALRTGAISARVALAFLGGPLGIALAAAGVGLAVLATKTDIFTSAAQRARNASESLALALQSQSEETIEAAIADQQAIIAAQRRVSVMRQLIALLHFQPVTPEVSSPDVVEQADLDRANAEILRLEARRDRIRAGLTERTGAPTPEATGDTGDRATAAAERERAAAARERLELSRLQDQIELAQLANNVALVETLSDQLEVRRRTADLVAQSNLSEAEALRLATEFVDARREALDLQRDQTLRMRDLEIELELARARGDERAIRDAERRLEIERRIAELQGLGQGAAEERATGEVDDLDQARLEGQFREAFSDGVFAALDGDLGDFFEGWLRDHARRGLEDALNQVADLVFQLFSSAFSQSGGKSGSSGNIWADLAAAVFGSFGGGKAGGGPVNAGRTYMVGERGPELFRPNQPGVVIPNGALGGAMTVNVVDARTINFKGTSEELRQLEAVVAADRRTRYSDTVSIVSESLGRRQWGRR